MTETDRCVEAIMISGRAVVATLPFDFQKEEDFTVTIRGRVMVGPGADVVADAVEGGAVGFGASEAA